MDTLKYIKERFNIPEGNKNPYEIKDMKRENLYEVFAELNLLRGAEIGVYRGINALVMCEKIPNLQLEAIDFWKGYSHKRTQEKQDGFLRQTKRNLKKYIKNKTVKLVIRSSMGAVQGFPDDYFDFVYIDANHKFDFVMQDIIEWSKRVRTGGIVAGHDYYRHEKMRGVVLAVNSYVKAHRIKPWFVTSERRKRSFFWVKE